MAYSYFDDILYKMNIMGFVQPYSNYTFCKLTLDGHTYGLFKLAGNYTWGASNSVGATTTTKSENASIENTFKCMNSSYCTSNANYVFSVLKLARDCTNIDMFIPTSETLKACSVATNGTNYWSSTEVSATNAYLVNGSTVSSAAKTSIGNILVMVDLDNPYIYRQPKLKIGSHLIYNDGNSIIIS